MHYIFPILFIKFFLNPFFNFLFIHCSHMRCNTNLIFSMLSNTCSQSCLAVTEYLLPFRHLTSYSFSKKPYCSSPFKFFYYKKNFFEKLSSLLLKMIQTTTVENVTVLAPVTVAIMEIHKNVLSKKVVIIVALANKLI